MEKKTMAVVEQPTKEVMPTNVSDSPIGIGLCIAVFIFVGAYFLWTKYGKDK